MSNHPLRTEPELVRRLTKVSPETLRAAAAALAPLGERWRHLAGQVDASLHVPTSTMQWATILEDGDLHGSWMRLRRQMFAVIELCDSASRSIGRRLPHRGAELVETVQKLRNDARQVLWFRPTGHSRISDAEIRLLVQAAGTAVCSLLDLLSGAGPADEGVRSIEQALDDGDATASGIASRAAASMMEVDDNTLEVMADTFDVPADELVDDRGMVRSERVHALWKGDSSDLEALGEQLLTHLLPERYDYVPDPTSAVGALLVCPRPLSAHRAAFWTRELVLGSYAKRPDACVNGILGTVQRMQQNWLTHKGIAGMLRMIDEVGNDEEQLLRSSAELYRMVIEGPLRQTGIAVLRMLGGAPGKEITITVLAENLNSHRDEPLCALLSSTIKPEWRNPAAHEDLHWDPVNHLAMMGDRPVDLVEVRRSALTAYAAHQGFEVGVAIARAALRDLRRQLDDLISKQPAPALLERRISKVFGAYGLVVRDIRRSGHIVTLQLDRPGFEQLGLAGAALVESSRQDPTVERWRLRFPEVPQALEADKHSLAAVAGLVRPTERGTSQFPLPLGLTPLIAGGRISGGVPAPQVRGEIARLVLIQVVGESARLAPQIAKGELAAVQDLHQTLDLGLRALESSWNLLPGSPGPDLAALPRVLRTAIKATAAEASGKQHYRDRLKAALQRLRDLGTRTPPAVIPWLGHPDSPELIHGTATRVDRTLSAHAPKSVGPSND